jgi:hypothetical protein
MIAESEMKKAFDFQESPEGVLLYIFEASSNRDFSNFQYLCDPYAENDSDVNGFCYINLTFGAEKEKVAQEFENGRIMSETKFIGDDKAEIEFAYGYGSNQLETISFINRNGLWYLLSM